MVTVAAAGQSYGKLYIYSYNYTVKQPIAKDNQ